MINEARWHTFSLAQKIGNLGAEISRVGFWLKRGKRAEAEQAFERALECIDLTLKGEISSGGVKELLRLRELLADAVYGTNQFDVSLDSLEQYCLPFALIARRQKTTSG